MKHRHMHFAFPEHFHHQGFEPGPWGERSPGRRHGFGRGRERQFDSGEFRFVILALLAEQPSYGYQLIKAIEQKFSGGYAPSPGVIYPTLTMLEEQGLIVAETEGARKVYSLTSDGEAHLSENKARVDEITERVSRLGDEFGRWRSRELMEALQGLHMTIRETASRRSMTEEKLAELVKIVNRATNEVEQL